MAPKNGKTRSVSLPAFILEELSPLVEGRAAEEFVFGKDSTHPLRYHNFYSRQFRSAVKRLVTSQDGADPVWPERLAGLRFHDLRHTHASFLIAEGFHLKAVSDRLGHSSVAITGDRYGHLYEGHDEPMAERLDELFKKRI